MSAPQFAPLFGWLRRGPDFEQRFRGWTVFAERDPAQFIDLPVTIIAGHIPNPTIESPATRVEEDV